MYATHSSPARPALLNRTNVHGEDEDFELNNASCHETSERKRQFEDLEPAEESKKRVKVDKTTETDSSDDEDGPVVYVPHPWRRRFVGTRALVAGAAPIYQMPTFSTRPILQSFVSSHKADIFKTCSAEVNAFISLPYACQYSNSAKQGGEPLLAVTTEQGIVHILNTRKRRDWDCEPQRISFQPYPNGIFDVQWSADDKLLATASANSSVQISSIQPSGAETLRHLRGHTGSVKTIAWDKRRHGDILYSGGRDGAICVWDLRVGENVVLGDEETTAALGTPVIMIPNAHPDAGKTHTPRGRKGKFGHPAPLRSVTSLLYSEANPYGLISSGSIDGILRHWDLRLPSETPTRKTKSKIQLLFCSSTDPTTYRDTRRARGITSLAAGTGPTAGQLFALGNDSRIHTYQLSTLEPLSGWSTDVESDRWSYSHPNMRTNSFYVRIATSPCGRWVASGGANNGSVYLFDVSSDTKSRWSSHPGDSVRGKGIELHGQTGEVGAVDWAEGTLASCADDGTVRVWRSDIEIYRECEADPEKMKWDFCWAVGEP